jgi:NADH-quinone oxidoreductase subunit D
MALGFTGAMLRGSGIVWDLRKKQPYESTRTRLRHPGRRERRLLRPLPRAHRRAAPEHAHHQAVHRLAEQNPGPVMIDDRKVRPPRREEMKGDMESLIHHFKLFTEGYSVPEGETYAASKRRRASSAST